MAVSLVGVTSGGHSSGTITVSTHASTQIGDIVVAFCHRDEGYGTSAWTGTPFTLLRDLSVAGTGRGQIWARQATAAGATSYSYTDSSGNSAGTVTMFVWRGAVMPTAANTAAQNTASSGTPQAPTVGSGTLAALVCSWGTLRNYATKTFGIGTSGLTAPIGQVQDPDGYWASYAAYGLGVSAGAKACSLSPNGTTRALSLYLVASAAADQNVTVANGIPSAESVSTPSVVPGAASVSAGGVPSAESVPAPTLAAGPVSVSAASVPSAESVGVPALQLSVSPASIPSAESVGAPTVQEGPTIAPAGIPSAESVGVPTLVSGPVLVTAPGISSAESVPAPSVQYAVNSPSIPSSESVGTPTITVSAVSVTAQGIPSVESVPAPTVAAGAVGVSPTSIPSAESVGVPTVRLNVVVVSIPSSESVGTPTLLPDQVSILVASIPSAESVPIPTVSITIDLAKARVGAVRPQVGYELQCIARIQQVSGPPALLTVESIVWKGLSYADTLSQPQYLKAVCPVASLKEPVLQRLDEPFLLPTELRLLRNGQIVFAGPLRTWHNTGDDIEIIADGLLAYAQRMFVWSDLRYTQVDQHLIAKGLIDHWQNGIEFGHFGIDTTAVAPSGTLRDRSYVRTEIHQVAKRIEELGQVIGGFDAEVDPATRKLQLWTPTKGVDRSQGNDAIIFDDRNITSPDVAASVAPGDVASYSFGAGSSTGTETPLWRGYYDPELAAKYGASGVAASWSDVTEQATLDAHVHAALVKAGKVLKVPGPKTRVTPDADLSSWAEGDTVKFESNAPLGVNGAFRVRKRTVDVEQTGAESVSLEFV